MTLENLCLAFLIGLSLKALTVGSDFNLIYLIRDGSSYWSWYKNRPTYKEQMINNATKNT